MSCHHLRGFANLESLASRPVVTSVRPNGGVLAAYPSEVFGDLELPMVIFMLHVHQNTTSSPMRFGQIQTNLNFELVFTKFVSQVFLNIGFREAIGFNLIPPPLLRHRGKGLIHGIDLD